MEKGQFSIEFIAVLGALLILLGAISISTYEDSKEDARKLTRLSQAREAANELANALNTVYASGVGAKQTVEYSLPSSVHHIFIDEGADGDLNNRMDVQIEMNWERDNLVLVNTLIPSMYIENWQSVPLVTNYLSKNPGNHTVAVSYENYPNIVLREV